MLEIKCDEEDINANDYTIMVKNIPIEFEALNNDYDEDLLHFFTNFAIPNKQI